MSIVTLGLGGSAAQLLGLGFVPGAAPAAGELGPRVWNVAPPDRTWLVAAPDRTWLVPAAERSWRVN